MEIKIGMVELNLENTKTAKDYNDCMKVITRGLFQASGLYQNDCDINAMADNLQRFWLKIRRLLLGWLMLEK